MLDFLFRRLTAGPPRGSDLFESVTRIAREPHWYIEGKVPDTLDGRFAVLATVLALLTVRLEADGERGDVVSVGVTERFIAVMESEHRELGLGDPTLGKTVRKLVGSLARRTELWRSTMSGAISWEQATADSREKAAPSSEAIRHSSSALKRLRSALESASFDEIAEGKLR